MKVIENRMMSEFTNLLRKENIYHSPKSLIWYFASYTFKDIDLKNKILLDIGGGAGLASFYAASVGASKVILLEPMSDGSGNVDLSKFRILSNGLSDLSDRIELISSSIQDYDPVEEKFDVILCHNSINHIDEPACINLLGDNSSFEKYKNLFIKIYRLCNYGAKFIILDCSRNNFFNLLKLKNPVARTIEWEKHQTPETWSRLLLEAGFTNPQISWSSFKQLRSFGRSLLGNKIASYFLTSHFKLTVEKSQQSNYCRIGY